jgi:hypothetical protein
VGKVVSFDEIGQAHYDMEQGAGILGKQVVLIGASKLGLGKS